MEICGYCLGRVTFDRDRMAWVHVDSGDRVTPNGPGDMVSAAHNRAGTRVNVVDVITEEG